MAIDNRVSVLEVEQEHLKEEIKELKNCSNETYDMVFEIKERLAKQNGIIPHMSEQLKELCEQHIQLSESFSRFLIKNESTSIKTKIMWAIFGTMGSAVLLIIFKLLNI